MIAFRAAGVVGWGASQFLAQETCITRRLRACLATWRDQRATYTARIRKLSKNWDAPLAAYLVGGSFRNGGSHRPNRTRRLSRATSATRLSIAKRVSVPTILFRKFYRPP